MTSPSATIWIGGNSVESYAVSTTVILRENAVSNAQIVLTNENSEMYVDTVDLYDTVRIDLQSVGSSATERFGGYVSGLKPFWNESQGYQCLVDCLGYGVALKRMRVAQEYGTESKNPTVDTIREVLTDATYGVVPIYVNKVLGTATVSGYSIQTSSGADNYIQNDTTSFPYLKCPYTPAIDVLKDMCDLISANNYASEGAHWQVIPSSGTPFLCVDIVANHHAPITDLWPNAAPIGTITQGTDDVVSAQFWKAKAVANYVVYAGVFEKPTAERWTEGVNVHNNWTFSIGAGSSPAGIVGSQCVRCTGAGGSFYYPGAGTLGLDVGTFGTTRTIPRISFYLQRSAGVTGCNIELTSSAGNYYYHNTFGDLPNANEWRHFTLPVGPYSSAADWLRNFQWLSVGAPNWNSINYVWFTFVGAAGSTLDVDDLQFHGIVTRGAKSNAAIGSQRGIVKLVVDDVGKDDSLTSGDDSGMMAQLAKAELIRGKTTPIVGTIVLPMYETILPGQIVAVDAAKTAGGTFNIDDDFRIQTVKHTITDLGGLTTLEITDDVVNGYPLSPMNRVNLLLKAVNPDFQDRDRGSIKAREIDLLQSILEVNY